MTESALRYERSAVRRTAPGRSVLSWGAIFSGVLIGAALLTLLTMLWYALAQDNPGSTFDDNLEWWVAASGIVATFIAGFVAGWLNRKSDAVTGAMQGLTVWGLLTLATLVIGGGALNAYRDLTSADAIDATPSATWTSFWALLIGLVAAVVGGILGGMADAPGTEVVLTDTDRSRDVGYYGDGDGDGDGVRTVDVRREPYVYPDSPGREGTGNEMLNREARHGVDQPGTP